MHHYAGHLSFHWSAVCHNFFDSFFQFVANACDIMLSFCVIVYYCARIHCTCTVYLYIPVQTSKVDIVIVLVSLAPTACVAYTPFFRAKWRNNYLFWKMQLVAATFNRSNNDTFPLANHLGGRICFVCAMCAATMFYKRQ